MSLSWSSAIVEERLTGIKAEQSPSKSLLSKSNTGLCVFVGALVKALNPKLIV